MDKRKQAMIDSTDNINSDDDKDQQCRNDECDNLSDWQYLTATFDHDEMFTSDAELTRPSKRALDRLNNDNVALADKTQPVAALKRSRSNSTILDGYHDANSRNHGLTTNSAQWLRCSPFDNYNPVSIDTSQKNVTTSTLIQSDVNQIDATELLIKSWSDPQLRSLALSQSVGDWQRGVVQTSNVLPQSRDISDFPSQSISLSERSEKYPSLKGLFDSNEPNHFQQMHEPLETAQLPYTPLFKTSRKQANSDEYTRSQSLVRNYNDEIPRQPAQLERVSSSVEQYGFPKDAVLHTDHRFKSMYTEASQQPIPFAREMMTKAIERANIDESAAAYQKSAGMLDNTAFLHSNFQMASAQVGSNHGNIVVPITLQEPADPAIIEQEMCTWMSMIGKSPLIPPYQQFENKKLLLHPLTPYNYYYRDERDNIVAQITDESDPLPPSVSDFSVTKMQTLLHLHWFTDPVKKKRKHRKSHGKMNFQRLSKVIAQRWHHLPPQGRDFYRSVARYDDLYYHQQLEMIKQRPNP